MLMVVVVELHLGVLEALAAVRAAIDMLGTTIRQGEIDQFVRSSRVS